MQLLFAWLYEYKIVNKLYLRDYIKRLYRNDSADTDYKHAC